MTTIGVAIVSYNTCDLLRRCLRALFESRDVALAVVVVDNGSRDGSTAMVADAFPCVLLLRNAANAGFAAATNQALRALLAGELGTAPDYLLLLNSDAFVEPDTLATMLHYARLNAGIGVVAPQLRNPDGSLQPTGRPFPTLRTKLADLSGWSRRGGRNNYLVAGRDYAAPACVEEVPAACVLARRTVLEQVGLLDEGFRFNYEDVDWCRRVAAAGWRIAYLPAARVTHLWGASQHTRREWVELHSRRGLLRYFFKHGRPGELYGLRLALLALDLARIARAFARVLRDTAGNTAAREQLAWRVRIFATLVAAQGERP